MLSPEEVRDAWLGDLLGLPIALLWHPTGTVSLHHELSNFAGLAVFETDQAWHVSAPHWMDAGVIHELTKALQERDLREPATWHTVGREVQTGGEWSLRLTRDHLLLPRTPAPESPASVFHLHPGDLTPSSLEEAVSLGLSSASVLLGVGDPAAPTALAGLHQFRGQPAHLTVWVEPSARRQGWGRAVAEAALRHAWASSDVVRGFSSDDVSRYFAEALGFGYALTEHLVESNDYPLEA